MVLRACVVLCVCSVLCRAALPAEIKGFYSWNWGSGSKGPIDASVGVAFTGLIDVPKAIQGYPPSATWCCPKLNEHARWLSVGGGNAAGMFSLQVCCSSTASHPSPSTPSHPVQALSAMTEPSTLGSIAHAGFTGVMFDVEEVVGGASVRASLCGAACRAH